jgi:hypothetical protein
MNQLNQIAMDENILAQIRNDVQMNGDLEGLGVAQDKLDDFWKWFAGQAVELTISPFDGSKVPTDRVKQNRCFGNGQLLALEIGLDYFEGFMDLHGRFIHHGFNGFENGAFDATVEQFPKPFLDFHGNKPSRYYGLLISREMLTGKADQILKLENYNDPLLHSCFNQ